MTLPVPADPRAAILEKAGKAAFDWDYSTSAVAHGRPWDAADDGEKDWYRSIAEAALAAGSDEVLGECLMRARLALTAQALLDDGFSDDRDEPGRILSALCVYLVEHGAVDPMETP